MAVPPVSNDDFGTRHGRDATGRGGRTATSTSTSYETTSEKALFSANGRGQYDFHVTDFPIEGALRGLDFGVHARGAVGIDDRAEVYLTISLGEPYNLNNDCYKRRRRHRPPFMTDEASLWNGCAPSLAQVVRHVEEWGAATRVRRQSASRRRS